MNVYFKMEYLLRFKSKLVSKVTGSVMGFTSRTAVILKPRSRVFAERESICTVTFFSLGSNREIVFSISRRSCDLTEAFPGFRLV